MSLLDVIKTFLGKQDPSLSDQNGFLFLPDTNGVIYFVERECFENLKMGEGNALQLAQYVTFKMLEEQGLAKAIPNGYQIDSATVCALDDEDAQLLELPPRFSGDFAANIQGRTGSSGFRVGLSVLDSGEPVPFNRKGPLISLSSDEVFRLSLTQLTALQACERHSNLLAEERCEAENLRLVAELQNAARSGMSIDLGHFERLDVVLPDNISVIATRMSDGGLQLSPGLGEGSTPEQLEKRWGQVDQDSDEGVIRVDNRIVLLKPQTLSAVKEILGNRQIPPDKVPDFLASPAAFLDASIVDLELGFSVRVAGVGQVQHMDFGELDSQSEDWFSLQSMPENPAILKKLVDTPEDLDALKSTFSAAMHQGASSMVFSGRLIDISQEDEVNASIQSLEDFFSSPVEQRDMVEADEQPSDLMERVGVLIHEAGELRSDLLRRASQSRPMSLPDWRDYSRKPFVHQQEGIEWILGLLDEALINPSDDLYRLQGGLLADDMGLGKTFMALTAVSEYLVRQLSSGRTAKPALVVAPLSLLENWEDEVGHTFKVSPFRDIITLQSDKHLNKFRKSGTARESVQQSNLLDQHGMIDFDAIQYALEVGPDAGLKRLDMDRRLVLTTYQTLRDYQFSLCRVDWGVVVFDEAQNVKNPNAMQTRAAKALKADFKLLATGTPVENSLGDFWCLMDTAQPGLLGDWQLFKESWIKPILTASEAERDGVRADIGSRLREAVGSFMLRRVKEDQLKGLPTKTVHSGASAVHQAASGVGIVSDKNLVRPMTKSQLSTYNDVLGRYRQKQATDDMRGHALAALQELREVCLHPRLKDEQALIIDGAKDPLSVMNESAKLQILLEILKTVQNQHEKVIVFMQSKRLQRVLKLWLDKLFNLDIAIINGDTPASPKSSHTLSRKQQITSFEEKQGFNIIIMSPVAAGVGLTVVGANHVVHLERHWNPAKEAQASDRVYRIGQQKDVHIYLPIVAHPEFSSFDVHLDNLLRKKLMLKDAVVTPEAVSETEMIQAMGLGSG